MTKQAFRIVAIATLLLMFASLAYAVVTTIEVADVVFFFQNTTDNASNPVGDFAGGDRGTAVDGDEAYLRLNLENDADTQREFARITWEANDVTESTKDGEIRLDVLVNNVLTNRLLLDEDSVDLIGDTSVTGTLGATGAVTGSNLSGTNTGDEALSTGGTALDVTDHLIDVDITPSAGSATLVDEEDALQVKYDTANFEEGANGIAVKTNGIDISDETNLIAGTNITLTDDTLSVDDVFGWQDDGTTVRLVTTTDEVVIGGTSPLSSSTFTIDGSGDNIQALISGATTQTANILVIEQFDGDDVLTVNNFGALTMQSLLTVNERVDINGATNVVQLQVTGNITQSADLAYFEKNNGTDVVQIDNNGLVSIAEGIDGIGAIDLDYGSADVLDHTFLTDGGVVVVLNDNTNTVALSMSGDQIFHDTNADGVKDGGENFIDLAGSAVWTDADPIVPVTSTRDIQIGDGAGTLTGKLEIGGDADQPQLVIEGHSTQTDSLLILQNDADTEVFSVDVGGGVNLSGIKKRVFISATAGLPKTTSGCEDALQYETDANDVNYMACAFDGGSNEGWQSRFTLPENYDGGTFTATVEWTAAAGTPAETVHFDVNIMSLTNDDPWDTAFGTAQACDDALLAVDDFHETPESSAITAGGSPAGGHHVVIQVIRDAATDTHTTNVKFTGIWLTFGIDALSTED
jgi:hypothetical protein